MATPLETTEDPFRYVHSVGLPGLLEDLGAALIVTTYQVGKLAIFRPRGDRISMLPRSFEQAMGLAVGHDRLAIGTRYQICFLENDTSLARQIEPAAQHDACFLPRRSHVTGNIQVHEMAWGKTATADWTGAAPQETKAPAAAAEQGELWIVNTLFSCLCTLDQTYSFLPRWRPPSVSQVAPEDRCHLNGLTMASGLPKYVTAFGETDTPGGW